MVIGCGLQAAAFTEHRTLALAAGTTCRGDQLGDTLTYPAKTI
jgi:hypothetical protein